VCIECTSPTRCVALDDIDASLRLPPGDDWRDDDADDAEDEKLEC